MGESLLLIFQHKMKSFVWPIFTFPMTKVFRSTFYTQLTSKLRSHVNANLILGGDFNCPLENIDKIGEKDIIMIRRKNVTQSIVEMSNNLRLRSFGVIQIRISDSRFALIIVHQRNRRIHDQSGFTGSFDAPRSRQILNH